MPSQCFTGPNDLGVWRLVAKGVLAVGAAGSAIDATLLGAPNAGEAWILSASWNILPGAGGNVGIEVMSVGTLSATLYDNGGGSLQVRGENNTGSGGNLTWAVWGVVPP